MKRSGYNHAWLVLGALSLVLGGPIQAAETDSKPTVEEEAPVRTLKRPLPTTVRPATEETKPTAPATVSPRTTTPAAPRTVTPKAVAPAQTAPKAAPAPAAAPKTTTRTPAPAKATERTPSRAATGTATLTVQTPNGGETFAPGSRLQVQWQAVGISGPGSIQLLRDERQVAVIAASVNLSQGKTSWRIPKDLKAGNYTVRIQSRDRKYSDTSDQPFTIGAAKSSGAKPSAKSERERGQRPTAAAAGAAATPDGGSAQATPDSETTPAAPALGFIAPTTNTAWCTNQAHEFRWSSTLPANSHIAIDLMRSDGTTLWQAVAANAPDTGSYTWPGLTDAQFSSGMISLRPRIKSSDNSVVKTGGALHFGKPLMINAPQSNHTWRKGSQYTIRWTQLCDLPAPASLELLNAAQQPVLTIADGLPTAGNHMPRWFEWTVPDDLAPGTYHIRVRTADNQLVRTGSFKIANPVSVAVSNSLTFTQPANNAAWCTNQPHEFRWNSTLPANTRVRIDLMEANGEAVWRSIVADIPNSGSYAWNGYTDAQFGFGMGSFRPRIATLDNSAVTVGDRFHIGKHLFLEAPKSNYTWRHGASYDILWTQLCDLPATVSVELLDAGKQPVATLASGLGTAGSSGRQIYKWTVPNTLTPGTYHIRVRTADGQYVEESSFAIAAPAQF